MPELAQPRSAGPSGRRLLMLGGLLSVLVAANVLLAISTQAAPSTGNAATPEGRIMNYVNDFQRLLANPAMADADQRQDLIRQLGTRYMRAERVSGFVDSFNETYVILSTMDGDDAPYTIALLQSIYATDPDAVMHSSFTWSQTTPGKIDFLSKNTMLAWRDTDGVTRRLALPGTQKFRLENIDGAWFLY